MGNFTNRLQAVLFYQESNKCIAMIVDFLIPEAVLAKHSHFIIRQQLIIKCRGSQNHVTMRIPGVVTQTRNLILRNAFSKPRWHDSHRNGIRSDHIGTAVQHILTPIVFIANGLNVECRNSLGDFSRRLKRNHVGELVRDHIPQPVVRATQLKLHGSGPYFDLVIIIKRRPVGVIVMIPNDEMILPVRLVLVQRRYWPIYVFSDFTNHFGRSFSTVVEMHEEMFSLNRIPIQFRVIVGFRLCPTQRRKDKNANATDTN